MPKFFIETYGCQMNVSDSELVSTMLTKAGYLPASAIDDADIIIFNTCSVREHAEVRVLGRISNEISRKMLNPQLKIGVIGCMAQRMGEKLLDLNNKIDFVVGVDKYRHLPQLINNLLTGPQMAKCKALHTTQMDNTELYDDVYPTRKADFNAFISIMRGCNNFCSYCIVPYVRGRERSRPSQSIIAEVKAAAEQGFPDITLLGQNVNSYQCEGIDFPDLLELVSDIEALKRVRFITSHPKDISDKLIQVMADNDKICNHLHLPLQAGDNEILKRMNRGYTIDHYLNIVDKLRQKIPDIAITTDIMVGFPDESEKQFNNTVNAMNNIRFDFAFMFKYSVREGTTASKIPDSIDEQVKLARLDHIINLQSTITNEKYRNRIGRTEEVLVEKVSKRSALELAGKTKDFKIVVFPGSEILIGTFVRVKITDAAGWTLKGELIS